MTLEELDEQEDEDWDDDRLLEQIRYTGTLIDSGNDIAEILR